MKHLRTLAAALLLFSATLSFAQPKYGYANLEVVMSQMPEMRIIQSELETLQAQYQSSIGQKEAEITKLEQEIQDNSLPPAILNSKKNDYQTAIKSYELLLKNAEAELMMKQNELLASVMDTVAAATKRVAIKKGYDMIFTMNHASGPILLYAKDEDNMTKAIFEELGIPWPSGEGEEPNIASPGQ